MSRSARLRTAADASIDGRADQYALACVAFEMLAGLPPFTGDTHASLASQHMVAPVPSLRARRATLPERVERAVQRAMAKDPAQRYASVRAFARDMRPAQGGAVDAAVDVRSVLVLPFANVGSDPDTEYFADGLTDELTSLLSGVKALRVISRTSAMRLKGVERPLADLAREVNVRFVVEGSVRRSGNAVRISTRLIDTLDESTLWSDRFSGQLDDVFIVQEQMATRIARSLQVALTPAEQRRLARPRATSTLAYDYCLRAKQEAQTHSLPAVQRALALLDRALEVGGPDELLYGAKGVITVWAFDMGVFTDAAVLDDAAAHAARAFAADPDSVLGHVTIGAVNTKRGNIVVAARHLRRALALDPGNAEATNWLTLAYASAGCTDLAAALADRAVELDPLTPMVHCFPGFVAWVDGRPRDAIGAYERWYEMDPRSAYARACLGSVYVSAGEVERGLAMLDEAGADADAGIWAGVASFFAAAVRGDRNTGRAMLTPELSEFAQGSPEFAMWFAWGLALLNDDDRAMDWMETAVTRGIYGDRWAAGSLGPGATIASHPRYAAIVDQMRIRRAELLASLSEDDALP